MSAQAPDEALEEAARLARDQAPALCRRDPATGHSCAEVLASKWHALLKPGGKVVTVNRLRPGCEPQWVAFSVDQIWAYRARVEEAAKAIGLQVVGLGRAAEAYARRQAIFPLGSAQELRALFERAGFGIEHLSIAKLAPSLQQLVDAPMVPEGDTHAQLIAVRR